MVVYNFKKLQPVPSHKEFVDIVLTRTQRKTPSTVHSGFHIARIREFYMRKVRFTQQTFHDKLSLIVDEFPKLDDIHPFYADLINVLYDRDHYKLALGQLNVARQLIDNISKDYLRLLKYGDSMFRCKQLKRAALGCMCTVMRKQGPTLAYLEEVRKHLARLPSIDPSTRTLLVCGYPNVGKSSFMNKVTRADVEVQPYAFTTKSLFVGHMDYKYQRWQVIDTPGILDHPLESRNTIEMQSITALAHLQCAILFFLDISGECGYTIEQQVSLLQNISPLFVNKPVILVATKIDRQPWATLDPAYQSMINETAQKVGATLTTMSNFTEEGVVDVKTQACETLLAKRVEQKLKNNKKVTDVMNRLTVVEPRGRDVRAREASIPPSVLAARAAKAASASSHPLAGMLAAVGMVPAGMVDDELDDDETTYGATGSAPMVKRWLERDREAAGGGPGVYRTDTSRYYILSNEDWKSDLIPEIMDGKNVADYIDPDIAEKLLALEAEEEALLKAEAELPPIETEDPEQKAVLKAIRDKKKVIVAESRREKGKNRASIPRSASIGRTTAAEAREHFAAIGMDEDVAENVLRKVGAPKRGRSMTRRTEREDEGGMESDEEMAAAGAGSRARSASKGATAPGAKRARSSSRAASVLREKYGDEGLDSAGRVRGRSKSRDPATHMVNPRAEGLKDVGTKVHLRKLSKKTQRREFTGKQGESDRHIGTKMPKHLFSGKRSIGSNDWR